MKKLLPVVIILLLIGAYFLISNKQKKPQTPISEMKSQPTTAPLIKSSLLDLITQGKNLNCTFSTMKDKTESSGTVYISGKNIRTDFTTIVEGKKNTGSMIRDENYTYVWGMGMAQGIKMKNSVVESTGSAQSKQYFDPTAKVDYKCQPWIVNNSIFSPPANIKFNDFSLPSSQATGASGSSTTGNQAACAACNSLSDQAKTMCLSQLHCQ